jgi:hypothetical protein
MEAIWPLLNDPQPDIYLRFWKDDHIQLFDVKIPYGFEFSVKDLLFGFSTSFKHFMFVIKGIPKQLFYHVINTFDHSLNNELILL